MYVYEKEGADQATKKTNKTMKQPNQTYSTQTCSEQTSPTTPPQNKGVPCVLETSFGGFRLQAAKLTPFGRQPSRSLPTGKSARFRGYKPRVASCQPNETVHTLHGGSSNNRRGCRRTSNNRLTLSLSSRLSAARERLSLLWMYRFLYLEDRLITCSRGRKV